MIWPTRYVVRVREFCNSFFSYHYIKISTCYMNTYPFPIDHVIRNITSLFMNSHTIETQISEYHKLIMFLCRMIFAKDKTEKLFLCFKNFGSKFFQETRLSFKSFKTSFSIALQKFSPSNQIYPKDNNSPFINKTLRNAAMTSSKLKKTRRSNAILP